MDLIYVYIDLFTTMTYCYKLRKKLNKSSHVQAAGQFKCMYFFNNFNYNLLLRKDSKKLQFVSHILK